MKLYINICLVIVFEIIYSKNFIYNEDDWYTINAPSSILSISYSRDKIFFSSPNGIFVYDKSFNDFYYSDYLLKDIRDKNIKIVHYDNFRDNYWIVNRNGLMFRSNLSSVWIKIRFNSLDFFSHHNIKNLGSNTEYIIIETNNGYVFLDPFTGIVKNNLSADDLEIQLLSVNWSSSAKSEVSNIPNLSDYYIFNEWKIISNKEFEKNSRSVKINCFIEDNDEYKWIGTDSGELFIIKPFSNEIEEIKSIPPVTNFDITYYDKINNEWWVVDKNWIYNYSDIIYNQEMVFICRWDEKNNLWKEYYQTEYPQIMIKDINDVIRVDDKLYVASNSGLLIYDFNKDKWNLAKITNGLIGNNIFDLDYYDNALYLATDYGLVVFSTMTDKVITSFFRNLTNKKISDIEIYNNSLLLNTDLGIIKMNLSNYEYIKISSKKFENIEVFDNQIHLSKDSAVYLMDKNYKLNLLFKHNRLENFDFCEGYIWSHNDKNAIIYNINSGFKMKYNELDGIVSNNINDIGCDTDWVWFATENGLTFYNWRKYHINE